MEAEFRLNGDDKAAASIPTILLAVDLLTNKPAYYAGETIMGAANVASSTINPVYASKLTVSLNGVAGVGQMHKPKHGKRREIRKETTFCLQMKVDIPIKGGVINPGRPMSLPFQFELPQPGQLLSSLEASFGYVRYWIDAVFPELWESNTTPLGLCHLLIFDVVDSNSPQSMANGPQGMLNCSAGCCAGQANISFKLDRLVYMPGDVVAAMCTTTNSSKARLKPYLSFHQQMKFANVQFVDAVFDFDLKPPPGQAPIEIDSGFSGQFIVYGALPTTVQYRPFCPSVNDGTNPLMKISYAISLRIDIPGSDPISQAVPIVFGTVPYKPPKNLQQAAITEEFPPQIIMDQHYANFLTKVYNRTKYLPALTHLPEALTSRFRERIDSIALV